MSLTVNASGVVSLQTVELLTPEQVDEASKKSVDYRLPGGRTRWGAGVARWHYWSQ